MPKQFRTLGVNEHLDWASWLVNYKLMAINGSGISHLFALDNGNYLIFTGSIEHTTIALMNCVIHLGQLLDEKNMKAE